MEDEKIVIMPKTTTQTTIVKKKAQPEDLTFDNRFLVPINGGHRVANFKCYRNDGYFFDIGDGCSFVRFSSLDNVYVL